MTRSDATVDESATRGHDPYAALRIRNFRYLVTGSFLSFFGLQMQTVAVGWEVYERTGSPFSLALVGLVQVVPVVLLAIISGQVADRWNRKHVVMLTLVAIACSSLGLAAVSLLGAPVPLVYVCLFVAGVARAFQQPARASLVPQLVPRDRFANAVTWNTASIQVATVLGPALSGLVIGLTRRAYIVYLLDAIAALAYVALLFRVTYFHKSADRVPLSLRSFSAGLEFVISNRVVLGAIALDMFAVLLGGAVALLPIYAKDILQVGPKGLGAMRAAPAIGALLMSFVQSHRPPIRRAGRALLWSVVGFGVATIVFGVSRSFPLSLAMLFMIGAVDNVSVVIRHTLVQLQAPDELRGRVSAVNGVFISISNELGDFESGMVAGFFTPTIAVVSGGAGTLLVVAIAAWLLPELRRFGRLDGSG